MGTHHPAAVTAMIVTVVPCGAFLSALKLVVRMLMTIWMIWVLW